MRNPWITAPQGTGDICSMDGDGMMRIRETRAGRFQVFWEMTRIGHSHATLADAQSAGIAYVMRKARHDDGWRYYAELVGLID